MKSPACTYAGDFYLNHAISEFLSVAHAMADVARVETLRYFRTDALNTENKDGDGGFDPVTLGDRAAERAMREVLAKMRPQDGIFGEEFGKQDGQSGLTWVLDPIDGTRGFLCGTPTWGVLISVEDENGPILGVIDQPYVGERFVGAGKTATVTGPLGERALKSRHGVGLDDALLLTTFPEIGTDAERRSFERVRDRAKLTRYGMDCYGYALLAAGQVDLVIEAGLSAYDISAPVAVIQAAGGVVTNWQGEPVYGGGQVIAAGSPALHEEAMTLLVHA